MLERPKRSLCSIGAGGADGHVHAGARDRQTVEKQASRGRSGADLQENTRMTRPLWFVLMPFGKKAEPMAEWAAVGIRVKYTQIIDRRRTGGN